jgi:2'-5' RNA ligase
VLGSVSPGAKLLSELARAGSWTAGLAAANRRNAVTAWVVSVSASGPRILRHLPVVSHNGVMNDGASKMASREDGWVPERGQSAVVVPVPPVDSVVSSWRDRFDSSAAQGMPAHITVLYPFLPERRLTDDVLAQLRALCGELLGALEVRFARTARFPGVLYLDPEPADGLRKLTVAIADRWPEAPPYEGSHDDVVPHLTVAYANEDDVLDAAEADLCPRLPLAAALEEARLYVFDGARWRTRARLPLRGSRSEG